MLECPPFRHFEQIKHVHSRSLLVYKYKLGKKLTERHKFKSQQRAIKANREKS